MNPITLTTVAEPLIRQALAEDITNEDVSTAAIMPDAPPPIITTVSIVNPCTKCRVRPAHRTCR